MRSISSIMINQWDNCIQSVDGLKKICIDFFQKTLMIIGRLSTQNIVNLHLFYRTVMDRERLGIIALCISNWFLYVLQNVLKRYCTAIFNNEDIHISLDLPWYAKYLYMPLKCLLLFHKDKYYILSCSIYWSTNASYYSSQNGENIFYSIYGDLCHVPLEDRNVNCGRPLPQMLWEIKNTIDWLAHQKWSVRPVFACHKQIHSH